MTDPDRFTAEQRAEIIRCVEELATAWGITRWDAANQLALAIGRPYQAAFSRLMDEEWQP